MEKIELGDRVEDVITGLRGIVVGVTDWLYGCRRLVIQPQQFKDGKPAETLGVDIGQVELITKAACVAAPEPPVTKAPIGGPREVPIRGQDVSRL